MEAVCGCCLLALASQGGQASRHVVDEKGVEAMIINSSDISMSSTRNYASYTSVKSESISVRADSDEAALITISPESQNLMEQLQESKKQMEQVNEEAKKKNLKNNLQAMINAQAERAKKARTSGVPEVKDRKSMQIETLRRILEMLNSIRDKRLGRESKHIKPDSVDSKTASISASSSSSYMGSFSLVAGSVSNVVNVSGGDAGGGGSSRINTWVTHTVTSSFVAEVENTAFSTTGIARTADGREISFNVDLEMSRCFMEKNETYVQTMKTLVDPLVINVGSNVTSVSDQKFLFDLDADGKEEEISYLGQGSGFLALDKNNDGKINDGNELFGTKSGNGFEDLKAYDEDGNGWIDEADSIFNKLKVWAKNDDGTDSLVAIGVAGVGAIYLGSSETQFSLTNSTSSEANAVIQRTGVFLHENGQAGTIQHVDLAV